MKRSAASDGDKYIRKHRFQTLRRRVMMVLSSIVVFCTTYALILPAITMEQGCPIAAHTHDDSCYIQILSTTKKNPSCTAEDLEIHHHEAGCYRGGGSTVCGYADFVIHRHDDNCYDETGQLWCPLPVITAHSHSDCCYRYPETHTHGEACYNAERGELTCQKHQHTDDCRTEHTILICDTEETTGHKHSDSCLGLTEELICGVEEYDGHQHSETCLDESGQLVCDTEESTGHQHGDSCFARTAELRCDLEECDAHLHGDTCFQTSHELTCGEDSDHIHTDDCYSTTEVLICEKEETPGDVSLEPELICTKEEIIPHRHQASCFDNYGNPICAKVQVLQHQHGDGCFTVEEIPLDTACLTCQVEEAADHSHSCRCYGTWELTCEIPEHTHTEECTPAAQPEETEAEAAVTEPTETEPAESLETEPAESLETEPSEPLETEPSEPLETEPSEPLETEPSEPLETEPAEVPEITPDSPPVIPGSSGLPVFGTAYATSNSHVTISPFTTLQRSAANSGGVMLLNGTTEEEPVITGPVGVSGYISNAKVEYQVSGSDTWINVNGATDIPGDASFKLTVEYANIPIADLLAAGGSMTYTLPSIFRDATAEGVIKASGGNEVGTITTSGSTATITFYPQWLTEQVNKGKTVIDGDFYVQGKANLSQIPEDGQTSVTIGNVTINMNFAGDLIAQYGNVDITKELTSSKVIETDTGDYLEYRLTVTAGEDGCPDVSVVDIFIAGKEYIALDDSGNLAITAVSPADAQIVIDGEKMSWEIGTMTAGTRSLVYRVRLVDDYTGSTAKGNIQNSATVYSKTYERDSHTVTFTPKAGATLSKVGTNVTDNPDGSISITYFVWINAYDTNSYSLDNAKIVDSLDGKGTQHRPTDPEIRKYLTYDADSFRLYKGGANQSTDMSILEPMESMEGALVWGEDSNQDGKYNDSFSYYYAPLAPGDSRTLLYTVTVEPGAFIAAGNLTAESPSFLIQNRVEIKSDDTRPGGAQWLNGWYTQNNIRRKAWSRKLVGNQLTEDRTILMSGSAYNTDGAPVANPGSFTAPVGSYQYQIVLNEAGDWNMASANLKDTLGQYMQFVGYVQVDAYHNDDAYRVDWNSPDSALTDERALAHFQGKTPAKTFWIQVDGTNSFALTPRYIDSTLQNHVFRMTYYAKPVNTTGITQVVVGNTFSITGSVGIGNYHYVLAGIHTSANVTISGSNSFHAEKHPWYYENPKVSSGDFAKGTLYWVIQVDGNIIPRGTAIRDVINTSGGTTHYIRGPSLAGIYTGNLGEGGILAYPDFGALTAGGNLTPLASSSYNVPVKANHELIVSLTEDLYLDSGQSLYIIIKTEPSALPQWDRDAYTYLNTLQSSSGDSNWVDHGTAQKILYGSECIFKELGQVFTYSGTGDRIETVTYGTGAAIHPHHLTGAGTYVAWQIHLNYEGTLDGTYRVLEQIPAGMEVAYIRTYWLGNGAVYQNPRPATVPVTDLGDGWQPYTKDMSSMNGIDYITHYYIKGQQVVLEYHNLFPGGIRDEHAVEIQVVCKLTDPDVLMGGVSKDFNNVVQLLDSAGNPVGSDNHGVTLSYPGMQKGKDETVSVSGGKYPFVISLNEMGTDLMPGADTITLVDELGENLIINTASIVVKNTKTDAVLTEGWSSSVENDADGTQTLKIVLPDNQPLTIRYIASVNAPPGQKVTVSNNAHWEGYTTTPGGSVTDTKFEYEAGGSVDTGDTPQITVHKIDQYHNQLGLSGAEFALTEMVLQDGTLVPKSGSTPLSGTTESGGLLTFGKDSTQLLAYNKVYRIVETKAPAGYVLDSTPHYVLIAQQVKQADSSPAFPDYGPYTAAGVYIFYGGLHYTYEAKNHKGEILVEKRFTDVDDSPVGNLDGTYKFGLFTDPEGTKKVQETYVTYASGKKTVSPKFTNVELNTPYYVYELNDQGQPIRGGPGTVSGIPFVVSYDAGSITVTAASSSGAVTVTNRMNYAELPQTGGIGTTLYTTGGMLLTIAALCLLYSRYKRRREGSLSP